MKIIVCGGRHFNNYFALSNILLDIIKNNTKDKESIEIVSGHCTGADQLGERFAKQFKLGLKIFPAEWSKYGKSAGPIRNKKMIEYIRNDSNPFVLAFTSTNTKGTKYTLDLAKKFNINYKEIAYTSEDLSLELLADINEGISFKDGQFYFD